jgi:hypothetical protein
MRCLLILRTDARQCHRRSGALDIGNDLVRNAGIGAAAVHRSAQVIDDHRGTAPSQLQRIQTAETSTPR